MAESFAAFRRNQNHELAELAEEHIKHDLNDSDRSALKSAATTVSTATMIGTLAGLSLGAYFAFKVRSNRAKMFQAFRASEKPTHIKFASGREEAIPDITPLLKPTTLGDFATYTFFAAGGIFIGGELGLLIGGYSAKRSITKDPETKARIEKAFNSFRADVMRKQIQELEGDEDWEEGDPPIMSSKDAKAHLDNGNFDRVFDSLKADRDYWQLCVFLSLCMRIGVTISKKQLGYIKRIYKKVEPNQMCHGYKQIEFALKEYKSGEPYRLRDFDENGELWPDLHEKEDAALVGTEDTEDIGVKGKRKLLDEDTKDLEERAVKHTKV